MALRILDLYPAKWLERPEGYDLVGVKGVLDDDGQGLKGALDGAGCGAIMLRRAGAVQPAPVATVPSAQVQFNDDLLKLNREVFQLYQAGAYDQALAKANEAVALAERLYGADHPTAAAELKFVVQVLRAAGRSAEAEPLIRRALAIDEKTLGPDNPAVALDIQILVGVLIDKTLKDAQPPAEGNRILITGQLPEILEKAVPLALVASLLLLWIYRRAVKRSMGRRSGRTRLRRQAWTSSPRLRRPQRRSNSSWRVAHRCAMWRPPVSKRAAARGLGAMPPSIRLPASVTC